MDTVQPSSEIGRKLRNIRHARRKSLAVVAGLAGISTSYLSMLELGQRALDRRSVIVALANALEIAPSELTALPVPAPANGDNDKAIDAVGQVLLAVHFDELHGQVLPVEVLRARVAELLDACYAGQLKQAGVMLPGLIQDVHSSIAAGRDVAELLDVAVWLHTQGTTWLQAMGAGVHLRSLATLAARQAAQRRGDPAMLGLAAFGESLVMLAAGNFTLARTRLDSVTAPTGSQGEMQLAGMLALSRSLVAAADQRPADVDAALGEAAGLAEHTGEAGNAYSLGFGPTNVGLWSMSAALEKGDHERTVAIAQALDPRVHPSRSRQAVYWVDYGRALARVRGRRDDAVMALRRAEKISPVRLHRDPLAREVLAELLTHAKRDAVGRELRGMAYRAGLPV